MSATEPLEFVVLRGGLTLPLPVIQLALELEAKGVRLAADGDELLAGPRRLLTADDHRAIRRWKLHLLALLAYNPDDYGRPQ